LVRQAVSSAAFQPINSERYFNSRYTLMPDVSDKSTMSADTTLLYSAYHYSCIETNILTLLFEHNQAIDRPRVLDIGSGTGHWIDFYRRTLSSRATVGLDISEAAIEKLKEKYSKTDDSISLIREDFSRKDLGNIGEPFDIINSIGTIHHITSDEAWLNCLTNISANLRPGGVGFISDRLGLFSINDLFTKSEEMASWSKQETRRGASSGEFRFLLMRGRSKSLWNDGIKASGCRLVGIRRFRPFMPFPGLASRFNILMIRKPA
jgi:SAM-dependent methyltransferase